MLTRVLSAAVSGLEGVIIEVEVDVANRGFPTFTIVGLPDKAVGEARDRVRTAIINAGYEMPDSRITVNLAPADIPKVGSSFDLPIALGILTACGKIKQTLLGKSLFVGELSLEGKIRSVPGVISIALLARDKKIANLFVPSLNCHEASFIQTASVYPVTTLTQLVSHLNSQALIPKYEMGDVSFYKINYQAEVDFSWIAGQYLAKRALEIAAAGMHNIHLSGPPGTGKTMLSRAFPSILPPMDFDEVIEVSRIYSVVGLLSGKSFVADRPFRAPHHTTSRNGLIGGGSHPTPGEISLAHNGVLFLDEFPEFSRATLESLRQPLEDGKVTISRASGTVTFPSRFLLLAASNPCPCGYFGHPTKKCTCSNSSISLYRRKLSGPLLDRIDMHVEVLPVEDEKLTQVGQAEMSKSIRERVIAASERQKFRYKKLPIHANSQLSNLEIKEFCPMSEEALKLLRAAVSKFFLSARSYFKIIKIARTIADLDSKETLEKNHISEALHFRLREE